MGFSRHFFSPPSRGSSERTFLCSRPDVKINLVQDDSQKELAIIVRQPSVYPATYGTFYQFGRKDPLIRKSDPLDLAQGTITKVSKKQAKDISLSIQNPNSVY